jgi:branched-chain amino acid transport system substrate-binding protein
MAFSDHHRQARRLAMLGLAGAMLVVAGCGTRRGGPPPPDPDGPLPTALDRTRNMVAVIVPLSGADGSVGTSIANAANLALADTGEQKIRLTIYDSNGPGGAAGAAQRAVTDGNRLILGPLLANDVRAAAPIARAARVPVVAFSNDESVAGNGVYIMGFTPDQSISESVKFAASRGMKRYAAMVPSGLYGQRSTQAATGAVRSVGGTLTGVETYNRTQPAVSAASRRLAGKGPVDAVIIGDSGKIAAVAAPAFRSATKVIGTELWATETGLGKTARLRGAWYAAAPDAQFNQLVVRYRAKYRKTPYRLASLGYDAVLLAVRSNRNWPIGRVFPARSLIAADGFAGVDGNFRFGRDGVAERLLEVRQVTATGTTVVKPAGRAF